MFNPFIVNLGMNPNFLHSKDYDSCTQRTDSSATLCGWKDKVPGLALDGGAVGSRMM